MTYRSVPLPAVAVCCCVAWASTLDAQVLVTPNTSPQPLQNVQLTTVDASAGTHIDPHVDGPVISYTSSADDGTGFHIRYFTLGLDTTPHEIPFGPNTEDLFSKVGGTRIAYSHVDAFRVQITVFDTAQPLGAGNPVTINPEVNAKQVNPALRGTAIAYIDATPILNVEQPGDLMVFDTNANKATRVTNDGVTNQDPNLSPDGRLVVWEKCPVDTNHCDIWKAINVAPGAWVSSVVSDDPDQEAFPDTNGDVIVYFAQRADGSHIFYRDAANVEYELAVPQAFAPRIAGDFVTFASPTPDGHYDVFLFQLSTARLWNVTNSPLTDNLLSGVSVLRDGDVVVVYESFNPDAEHVSLTAVRFTVPPVTPSYGVCLLYDSTKAKKSGSTYPIQIQLCDAAGHNLSSPSVVVHAVGVTQLSTNAPGTLDDAGNSNPDFDFRYDATLAAYVFNLKTTGFATGTYALNFTAGADPAIHSAKFQIK